jgi:hypothetical protein
MTAYERYSLADLISKNAATMQNALPGSTLGKMFGQQQKMFNSVKAVKPMKFKGENVTGQGKKSPETPS